MYMGNSKDVLNHFKDLYREKYGVDYKVSSYPKEMTLIKKQLLEPHGYDKSLKIVEAMVENYENWNKNPSFKLCVASFTSIKWLQEKAIQEVDQLEHKKSQMKVDTVKNKEKTKSALDRILERSKKGGN